MNKPFYNGARDAMEAPFEPKTPCRNMPTRPCVVMTHDDSQTFPRQECLPHYCTRHTDHYEEGQIPHQWAMEEVGTRGSVRTVAKNFELGDYHDGPYCTRCEMHFCQYCNPKIWTETCLEQDQVLPGTEGI